MIIEEDFMLRAEVEHLKARVKELEADNERLRQGWRDAFAAIDKGVTLAAGKNFTKYPCECGGQISNSGWAARSHLRGKKHQAALGHATPQAGEEPG